MGLKTKIKEALAGISRTLMDRGGPDPREMLTACLKAMERDRKNLLAKTCAPNLYRVYLRNEDLVEMGPLLEEVRRELTQHLANEIKSRKYVTTGELVVDLVDYSELGRRRLHVDAMFTDGGSVGETPEKTNPPVPPDRRTKVLPEEKSTRVLEVGVVAFEILSGDEQTRIVRPPLGVSTLGRGADADFKFADPEEYMSRVHAELEVAADRVSIRDLGSANGTKVNGELKETAVLSVGDVVCLGKLELKYLGPVGAGE